MTRVLRVDPHSPEPHVIAEASRTLSRGGLVALPTETVYGLGANAFDEAAVARVFAAKGRPPNHPLIAHVADEAEARALSASWPERASQLAAAFWPGPLTLVVDRALHVPAAVAGGAASLAVRVPSHAVARAVIRALGRPIAAPSANRFQGVSPTTAGHVAKELGDAVDLVLDAGPCEAGIESTVVDVRGDVPRVLRLGAVSLAALRKHLSQVLSPFERKTGDEPRDAPGMGARHYAPRARLVLVATAQVAARLASERALAGGRAGLIIHSTPNSTLDGEPWPGPAEGQGVAGAVLARWLPCDPAKYARLLYGALHDLDDAGVDLIVVQEVPDDDAWCAVADRLRRGASG